MRFNAPAGATAITLEGIETAVRDGTVELPEAAASILAAHGFMPAAVDPAPDPAPNPAAMRRDELLAFLKARGVAATAGAGLGALRAQVRALIAAGS